jgi:hypothetical protein
MAAISLIDPSVAERMTKGLLRLPIAVLATLTLSLCSACVPSAQPGLVGVSGDSNSIEVWLAPCPGSSVKGLQLFRSYPGWDPEKDRPLWTARSSVPLATGVPIDVDDLPSGATQSSSIESVLGGGEVALGVSEGTTGGTGVGYVTFRPSDLSRDTVWLDGRELTPDEFRAATSDSC